MGELIVGIIIVVAVFLIVKDNKKKIYSKRYQALKRDHEAKLAEQAKQAKQEEQVNQAKQINQVKVNQAKQINQVKRVNQANQINQVKRVNQANQINQVKVNQVEQVKQSEADRQGKLGEQMIVDTLEYLDIYGKILSNVYVPKVGGKGTTEIDVIYINQYGIYVIESKNYNGSIYGDDKYDKWVVYYRKSRDGSENKFHFYNPVKQNEAHINHLSKRLWAIAERDLHSIIVFIEPFNMKVNSKSDVVVLRDLNSLINKYENGEETVFSKEEVDKIYNSLKPYTDVSDEVKKVHLMQAKRAKRYSNKEYFYR